MGRPSRIKIVRLAAIWNFFRSGHEKLQKTAFFAKIPSPQYFCVGKFFRDRTMRKLSSRGFRKCGTFGSCELFNGSYCCSKSTDFEIFGLSPKIRGVKKKKNCHNFEFLGTKRISAVVHPMNYLGYSFQARKIKIVAVLFFFNTSSDPFFFWKFHLTLTVNNSPLKSRTPKKYHIFGKLSIWKFWVNRVLVSLVFHVFSTEELTSHWKNSEFGRLGFFVDFFL